MTSIEGGNIGTHIVGTLSDAGRLHGGRC